MKSWVIGKDHDEGKDWGQEEKQKAGWDGWMSSLTQCTRVWENPWRWWRTGKPGVLQYLGSQRVKHNLATEQQQQFSPQIPSHSGIYMYSPWCLKWITTKVLLSSTENSTQYYAAAYLYFLLYSCWMTLKLVCFTLVFNISLDKANISHLCYMFVFIYILVLKLFWFGTFDIIY